MRAFAVVAVMTAIFCTQFFCATVPIANAQQGNVTASVVTQPSPIPAEGPVLVSMLELDPTAGISFIELWNTSTKYEDLSELQINLLYTEIEETSDIPIYHDMACQIVISGYIAPKRHVTFATAASSAGAYQMQGCEYSGRKLADVQIVVLRKDMVIEHIAVPQADGVVAYARKTTGAYKTGVFTTDFKASVGATPRVSELYNPPHEIDLAITEIFPNSYICAVGDDDPLCRSYVKVVNMGSEPIDLSSLRLRNGKSDANASASNTSLLTGIIKPGEYQILSSDAEGGSLAISSTTGATWLEDKYGLVKYRNVDTPYKDADLTANKYRSWAYDPDDDTWKWATPAPEALLASFGDSEDLKTIVEDAAKYVPCEEGKYRSPETNRCRTIVTETADLKPCDDGQYRSAETNRCRATLANDAPAPCKDGQYRSEETNRCRTIAVATATDLKPCADDQVRNPETNRCRKISTAATTLQPCATGQERNPETNRCRKIQQSAPAVAGYAVEPIKQADGSTSKWWALGGVLALVAGYGIWEWRHELRKTLARVATFASGRK